MKLPTREQVLDASKECPDAYETLKILFPDAFEVEEAKDAMDTLTPEFKLEARKNLNEEIRKVALGIARKWYETYYGGYHWDTADEIVEDFLIWFLNKPLGGKDE